MPESWMQALEWMRSHPDLLWWSGLVSVLMFVGSLLATPVLVAMIPERYFVDPHGWWEGHWFYWPLRIVRNLFGLGLIAVGFAMLVLPGQGILTILLGVLLIEFPGKRRLEVWLIRHRSVARPIAWMRQRANRPPLQIPVAPDDEPE